MSKINETNYPRRTQANYADTDMLVLQEAGGNTYTTRIEDMREDYQKTLAPTVEAVNDALAPAENGSTASQSYAIGDHFMRDGAFCTAIAAITSGGSFTLNTNYKVDDVANNLEQLNSDIANKTSLTKTDVGANSIKTYVDSLSTGSKIEWISYASNNPDAPSAYEGYAQIIHMSSNYKAVIAFSRDGNIYVLQKAVTWGTWKTVTMT